MVVDAHHGGAGMGGQQAAHAVMSVHAAHHEAAAMHIHDHGQLLGLDGIVVANLELGVVSVPANTKLSGNDWIRAASNGVNLR